MDNRVQKVDELCVIVNEMVRLIDTAAVPIFAVDASGVINGWNSKAAEVTGLAVEQAIGKPVSDLVEDDSVETVKNMLALALEGNANMFGSSMEANIFSVVSGYNLFLFSSFLLFSQIFICALCYNT